MDVDPHMFLKNVTLDNVDNVGHLILLLDILINETYSFFTFFAFCCSASEERNDLIARVFDETYSKYDVFSDLEDVNSELLADFVWDKYANKLGGILGVEVDRDSLLNYLNRMGLGHSQLNEFRSATLSLSKDMVDFIKLYERKALSMDDIYYEKIVPKYPNFTLREWRRIVEMPDALEIFERELDKNLDDVEDDLIGTIRNRYMLESIISKVCHKKEIKEEIFRLTGARWGDEYYDFLSSQSDTEWYVKNSCKVLALAWIKSNMRDHVELFGMDYQRYVLETYLHKYSLEIKSFEN